MNYFSAVVLAFHLVLYGSIAAEIFSPRTEADRRLVKYFRSETAKLAQRCLQDISSLETWKERRPEYARQAAEMLGLDPFPKRTELNPVVTGKVDHENFTVEKVQFQSQPRLYVTANLYLPKGLTSPAPTVLYLAGHGPVITNGISYGNKVAYQHHGIWFAQNGYACLIVDTLQLGEIQGLHHGTHREGMWWWNSRGYSPAGVETWNNIRTLDYLSTRPEVDTNRIGVTGRSGGGSYSWTLAAVDDRVKVIAPVAGITDLENHVVDGAVEGHCDCMFIVNTYGWDYPLLAALAAPRALLIANTDSDWIFPLDGVSRLHAKVRNVYALHQAKDKLGLLITPGPHKDTQDLQLPVLRWFDRHLKGEERIIATAATKLFSAQQLKVFAELPGDSINSNIHDQFVPAAPKPNVPSSPEEWRRQSKGWLTELQKRSFRGWSAKAPPLHLREVVSAERNGSEFRAYEFTSQEFVPLRLYVIKPQKLDRQTSVRVTVLSESEWERWLEGFESASGKGLQEERKNLASIDQGARAQPLANLDWAARIEEQMGRGQGLAFLAPRGIGLDAWSANKQKHVHLRR